MKKDKHLPISGKDSKKLSQKDREKYAKYLKYIGVPYVIVNVSNKIIDKTGISVAIRKAIKIGLEKIFPRTHLGRGDKYKILLDGGLKAPKEFTTQKTIIKGDEKEKIIAWASILAKVSRDALMCRLAKKYPKYGFEIHKGYGTLSHRKAIKKYGLSDVHRKSFCKKYYK